MNVLSLKVLSELGYSPILPRENIIFKSFEKSLEIMGKDASTAFLNQSCSAYGISEMQLLTNYKLIEESLYKFFRKGANVVLRYFRQELLKNTAMSKKMDTVTNMDIIKEIYSKETIKFANENHSHDHIAILYENENMKQQLLLEFFNAKVNEGTPKGLVSVNPVEIDSLTDNLLYEDVTKGGQAKITSNFFQWASGIHALNRSETYPTIIAGEYANWFFKNDLTAEILSIETNLGRRINENMLVLCPYDVSDIVDENILGTIVKPHKYIILSDLPMAYKIK